jgi:hypothetical protein
MLILVLAANSAFAGFPRLASILARDGYMPHQMATMGDRLVFSNGIIILGVFSCFLIVAFGGNTHALIPLYAVGVFLSFTLSQAGMVRRWLNKGGPHWKMKLVINGIGAITTAIATGIIATTKFSHGAWIVIVVIPILVATMLLIRGEYRRHEAAMAVRPDLVMRRPHRSQRVVVAATSVDRAVVQAVQAGSTMADEVDVVHVALDREEGERFREQIVRQLPGVHVAIVESPYRTLVRPLIRYLEVIQSEDPDAVVIVLLPEHLAAHWWDRILYNQNAAEIRRELVGREHVVVLDVPYRRELPEAA